MKQVPIAMGIFLFAISGCGFNSGYNKIQETSRGSSNLNKTPEQPIVQESKAPEDMVVQDEEAPIEIEENIAIEDAIGENMLINGSFEYPEISSGWSLHASEEYDQELFGWDVRFMSDMPCSLQHSSNTRGLLEIQRFQKDYQWAELDSHCRVGSVRDTNIEIRQTISLSKGSYVLTFRFMNRTNDNSKFKGLKVTFGNQTLNLNNENDWQDYTAKLTVNSDQENILLSVKETGEGNSFGSLVDEFVIAPIIE